MKLIFTRFFLTLTVSLCFYTGYAQQSFFTDAAEPAMKKAGQQRVIIPEKYRTLQLDTAGMLPFLRSLPSEQNITDRNNAPVILLPMPDGSMARFHIWESAAMAPELAAAYPNIKTFTGQGIDDRTATIKLDWTEFGFHAMILSPAKGQSLIDPYDQKTVTNYISYYKADHKKKDAFQELMPKENSIKNAAARLSPDNVLAATCVGTQLRTYRLALACTGEYAAAATGITAPSYPTKAQILSKVVLSVNRVNGVYEKEVAIRLVLVANDTLVLFPNPATDPFTANNNGQSLLGESQTQIDQRIGSANYDIGHTFSTGAGGIAVLGCVCIPGIKAQGVTGSPSPVGDAYDIDFVAHEMGHQFNASHTFNNANACGVAAPDQNAEPGSGVTIMAYAGVCGSENLAQHSIPFFHAVSYDNIVAYSISGSSCGAVTATGNTPPVVTAGSDYTIPKSTPFVLSGSATDANDPPAAISYAWEQIDVGGPNGTSTSPSGNAPLFRSFDTAITGTRYFPKLSDVINNTTSLGELLPSYARTMHFRLTARDNHAAGGGVCSDEAAITVAGNSGPFIVTYPTASGVIWSVNDFKTVTWDPSGTQGAPINCSNVDIQLSSDGGNTFPITLMANTPNDGSQEIQVPNNISAQSRIRIAAVGNVFYDISNSNFRIQNATSASFALNNPDPVSVCSANSGSATLLTGALGSFFNFINLSASLNPAGTTVSFGSSTISAGDSTSVTLNNTNSLAPGTYTIRVTATGGTITKTVDIQFIVGTAAPAALSAPGVDSTGLSTTPTFNWTPVPSASSYTLEIATVSDFSSGQQAIPNITSLPYTLTSALQENTTYFWRVRAVTSCGTGSPSAVSNRFRTGLSSCRTSTNVPVTIPANGTPRVTSTLTIPAAAGAVITDLNIIGLTATHNRVNDLTFILKAPNGDSVVVLNQVCAGSGNSGYNINLDDQAAAAVACPPTGGATGKPTNLLSFFNGRNSAGTWTLVVKDNNAGSGGNLTGWGLNINGGSGSNCTTTATPLAIVYTFTGTGNWSDAANWSNNTVPPSSLPSGASIVIDHAVGGVCTLNVAQTISAGATLTVMTGKNLVVPGTLTVQ